MKKETLSEKIVKAKKQGYEEALCEKAKTEGRLKAIKELEDKVVEDKEERSSGKLYGDPCVELD